MGAWVTDTVATALGFTMRTAATILVAMAWPWTATTVVGAWEATEDTAWAWEATAWVTEDTTEDTEPQEADTTWDTAVTAWEATDRGAQATACTTTHTEPAETKEGNFLKQPRQGSCAHRA